VCVSVSLLFVHVRALFVGAFYLLTSFLAPRSSCSVSEVVHISLESQNWPLNSVLPLMLCVFVVRVDIVYVYRWLGMR